MHEHRDARHGHFHSLEESLAKLECPERGAFQRPEEVIATLRLAGNETVVDLGAGTGYFTWWFARAVPHGKVVALEPEAELLAHIRRKVKEDRIPNVEALPGDAMAPPIPPDADVVFLCNVLHHVEDRAACLAGLAARMKPGARLVLIEHKPDVQAGHGHPDHGHPDRGRPDHEHPDHGHRHGHESESDTPHGPPEEMRISAPRLMELAEGAGFARERLDTTLLPEQVFLIYRRP